MPLISAPSRLLPLALALTAALPALQAQAQQADATATAAAAAAAAEPTMLETIRVTARRREESAQEVPTPISTLGGNELEAQRISQVQDLQQLLPGVNANYVHARQSSLAVRGIGNNLANEGLEGSVGIYLDNVYLGRPGAAVFDLLDIEQIDLLRGPQGTLFGKNTTAGVLNISTRKPTFTPDHTLEVSAGNRGYYQLRAAFSGPLSETLAGRVSLAKTHDDGWIDNITDGRKLNSIDRDGIRGQLLYQPHADFSLRLIGEYNSADDSQGAGVITGLGPVKAGSRTLAQAAAQAGAVPLVADWTRYESTLNGPQSAAARQSGLSAEAEWKLGSGYTLTSISAVRNWKFNPHNDVDVSTASAIADLGYTVKARQASQELRLASPTGEKFDYVVGGYYFWQDVKNTYASVGGPYADLFLLPTTVPLGYGFLNNVSSLSHGAVRTTSIALFGQGNWHIDNRWDVTAGLRGTYEEKKAKVSRDAPTGGAVLPTFPAPFAALNAIRPGQYAAWSSGPLSQDNFGPSALLGTSYKLQPGVLAYTSLSHGEKSGGFNANGVGSGPSLGVDSLKVGPERANNLELGVKSTLWDRRLLLNANAYYARVSGYQATSLVIPAGGTVPLQVLSNVGEVESKGFEWQIQALPARGLQLIFNGAFNDATYRSFENAPVPAEAYAGANPPAVQNLTGQRVYGAPRWTLNLGGSYRWNWSDRLSQSVAANYAWRSWTPGYVDNSIYSRIRTYGLLNVSTTWQYGVGDSNTVEFSLWARNLLDKKYLLATQPLIQGAYLGSPGAPRSVGVTLRYNFS